MMIRMTVIVQGLEADLSGAMLTMIPLFRCPLSEQTWETRMTKKEGCTNNLRFGPLILLLLYKRMIC